MISSIPSPSSGTLDIGPLSLNAYGLMIALGVVVAAWLCGRRFEHRGIGTREDVGSISAWAVAAGVIGARLYHVATDWARFENDLGDIPKIWEGGLGIPGGMLAGVLVGVWMVRRKGIPIGEALSAAAPALPLAQAIGRWGNWFNQELFGRPTDLPWALEIDDEHLPAGYSSGTTFHPTFLYESLWNFALAGVLILVDRRWPQHRGRLMAMYLIGYGVGRFWIEGLRIDEAHEWGPWRLNQWMAIVIVVGGLAWLLFVRNDAPAGRAGPLGGDDTPPGIRHDEETLLDEFAAAGEPVDGDTVAEDPVGGDPTGEAPLDAGAAADDVVATGERRSPNRTDGADRPEEPG